MRRRSALHFQVSLTGLLSLTRRFPKEADKVLRQGDLLEASPRSSLFKEFSSLIKRMRIKEPFLHLMPIQWSSFLVSLLFSTFSTDASTWLGTGNIPVHNGRKRKLPSGIMGAFYCFSQKWTNAFHRAYLYSKQCYFWSFCRFFSMFCGLDFAWNNLECGNNQSLV